MWVHLTNAGSADLTKYDGEHFYLNAVGQNYIAVQLGTTDLSTFSNIKIKFKYADNTYSPDVDMVRETLKYPYNDGGSYWVKNNDYNVAVFYFNQAGFLGVAGNCVATISFISSGTIAKTGAITFYIEDTVVEEDVPITTDQYAELQLDIADRWKRFLGTTEERLAAEKDQYTIYVDTTTGTDYIWNGSSFVSLGERNILTFDVGNDNHINSIYYKSNSSEGTYYPTRVVTFNYNSSNDKSILIEALSELNLPYNSNYLYFNSSNNQLYYYNSGLLSLQLIGALQNLFLLTWDTDGYVLSLSDKMNVISAAHSKATNFIIFEFSGGDYDGRRYLMNYRNPNSISTNLVCVDFEIDTETGKVSQFEKFKIVASYTSDAKGTWTEVASDNVSAVDSDTFIIGDTTYNIPNNVSDLNNDAGYLTASSSTITSMQTAISGKQDVLTASTGIDITSNTIKAVGVEVLTTAPVTDNTSGLKFVVLSSEPATKYDGYLYIITGSGN